MTIAMNFAIAAAGNMLGGLVFVTLFRTSQAIGSDQTEGQHDPDSGDEKTESGES